MGILSILLVPPLATPISAGPEVSMSNLIFVALLIVLLFWALNHYGILETTGKEGGIDRRVIQAARGDRALAKRLMMQVRLKYPDKSDRWHVEKVLYDLGRDYGYTRPTRTPIFRFDRSKRRRMMEDMFFISALLWFLRMVSSIFGDIFRRF